MNNSIERSQWTTAEKIKLKKIMSDSTKSFSKKIEEAEKQLNRTRNACAGQYYFSKKINKKRKKKNITKRNKAIVEKVMATPIVSIKEAKRLPIVSIMRNGELLKVNCIGGTNGTTIYKADNLIIIVDTNN